MGFLNNALPFTRITWEQQTVPSGLAAIFGLAIAALVFRDERLGPRRLIGVLIGFFGVSVAISLHNPTALAYLLLYQLIAAAGAGNASLNTFVAAPTAMLMGALLLEESLPLRAYPGFALIALGLVILDGRILRHFSRASGDRPG